jgi:hypothetical protein
MMIEPELRHLTRNDERRATGLTSWSCAEARERHPFDRRADLRGLSGVRMEVG